MRKLVIERAAVKHNLSIIKERAAGAVIYGVLTGDGGGAGIVPMAKLLRAEGIGRFAVYEVQEAKKLREAGLTDEEILMLRSTTDREELERQEEDIRRFHGTAAGRVEVWFGVRTIFNATDDLLLGTKELGGPVRRGDPYACGGGEIRSGLCEGAAGRTDRDAS